MVRIILLAAIIGVVIGIVLARSRRKDRDD
jgi:ABC-type proline/glycine betaine transport system permease subunit